MNAIIDVLVKFSSEQWDTFVGGIGPFTALLLAGWLIIWLLQKWHYGTTIKSKDATIETQNQRIHFWSEQVSPLQKKVEQLQAEIAALPQDDPVVQQHSQVASGILSDLAISLEALPAHQAASGSVGPVPFDERDKRRWWNIAEWFRRR